MGSTAPATDTSPRKFMFERSFDDGSPIAPTRENRNVTLTYEQQEALKKEHYDAGFDAGRKTALDEQTQSLNIIVETISASVGRLIEQAEANRQSQEARLREAVFAVARKIMPEFCQRNGLPEIEAVLAKVIGEMNSEPRLVVRVNDAQFDAIDTAVKSITEKQGYTGKVVILADVETRAGDCRIEWADGGVERNLEALWQSIGKTLAPEQAQAPVSSDTTG